MEKSLGVCIGASTVKIAELLWDNGKFSLGRTSVVNHECNPKKVFLRQLDTLGLASFDFVCITGRRFKESVDLPKTTEPEAIEYALKYYLREKRERFNALISLGSENFILYELDEAARIIKVQTGNKCASGTGEFFLQQIRRMNVGLDEAIKLAKGSEPYYVSGRCSVFCKSDCTHALNKGIPIGRVCAGLGNMITGKIVELLQSTKREDILIVGGLTKNNYVVERLKEKLKNLTIPEYAGIFEAIGAAIFAYEKKKKPYGVRIIDEKVSFNTLPSLKSSGKLVTFKDHETAVATEADEYILGLDAGSTTTKAVLLRIKDNKVVASAYLRTNGDPVRASRECYAQVYGQLQGKKVEIIGLGATGSGRKIAGLHALTDGIINEIIAHATAAAFFDRDVDTIIEIGGQDAKYTYLVNGVPCDYAMNEACSAGTGSFLEEAARESLNINYLDIQDIGLRAKNPVNFNDQCAAFISSDIKNASHENISKDDIVAGLIYSICMNYNNRVKGPRAVGKKIFMQGGVCCNKAVPLAMAGILRKEITVPPMPGLMGAFGVALEIERRIQAGLMRKSRFDLKELSQRQVQYGKSFICPGTTEGCDRGCTINVIKLNGQSYPFGGICNKYYNILHHISIDPKRFDVVQRRQELVFSTYKEETPIPVRDVMSEMSAFSPSNTIKNQEFFNLTGVSGGARSIGLTRSFLVNHLYPLYYYFFSRLGLSVVLPETADKEGCKRVSSSFCFPVELSHGMFASLIKSKPDYIFLPQVSELYVEKSISYEPEHQCSCVILQSEPYILRSAFRDINIPVISPVLDFSKGWHTAENEFVAVGKELGFSGDESRGAFKYALKKQMQFLDERKVLGDEALRQIESDKSKTGIVIFGRPYNAFAGEANLGIPRKFASRGYFVIPFDCLRFEGEDSIENMNWALGQEIIKAARFVKRHPQLFAVYMTNFSCGPDSFIAGYFRDIMNTKPSLTLELDSHSADAGINTRIEAFLDIVARYRKLAIKDREVSVFAGAELIQTNGKPLYLSSNGKYYSLRDPRIKIIMPSMGRTTTELASAAFRGIGFSAEPVELPSFKTLMTGRNNTSCKECLPLILTAASLLEYIEERKNSDELLLYFMPTVSGNCRFSQYYVFLKKLIEKKRIEDVALLTFSSENGYAGIGPLKAITLLKAIIVADVMDDIKNALLVLAGDKRQAQDIFNEQWHKLLRCFEAGAKSLYRILEEISSELAKIKLNHTIAEAKKVLLAGEIYVRKDEFSSQGIVDRLARRDIVVRRSSVLEWIYYVDFIVRNQLKPKFTFTQKMEFFLRQAAKVELERKIKKIFSSGLYEYEPVDIEGIMKIGSMFINPRLTGEAILVVGSFFKEIAKHAHGVISVGPFSCMPTRVTESILSQESRVAGNTRLQFLENNNMLSKFYTLPFLSVECDGNPFPQIVESRIEAFCLQVERLHEALNLDKALCKPSPVFK